MDGIINVYKEKGYTSHDVVAKMRGILRMKKIGHTGTLDPEAEGVLPVCLGSGTRLCDMLADRTKTYRAVLLLSLETDTQDTTGRILAQAPVQVTGGQVRQTAASFLGTYMQVPPMYSALKVGGKKLYELARAGKEVERAARPVEILELKVEDICLPRVTLEVTCSKGTYIRTLCHDIGRKLGCGGCMEGLVRTRVGEFCLEDSLTLDRIEALRDAGQAETVVCPVDRVFAGLPGLRMCPGEGDKLARNGNPFRPGLARVWMQPGKTAQESGNREPGQVPVPLEYPRVRVYDSGLRFIGVYEYQEAKGQYKPQKLFPGGS